MDHSAENGTKDCDEVLEGRGLLAKRPEQTKHAKARSAEEMVPLLGWSLSRTGCDKGKNGRK